LGRDRSERLRDRCIHRREPGLSRERIGEIAGLGSREQTAAEVDRLLGADAEHRVTIETFAAELRHARGVGVVETRLGLS
jgi:hypothetical protein